MRWFYMPLLLLFIFSCSKNKEDFVKLRISNQTNFRFSNVSSNGMNFGDIRKKGKSHYLKLVEIKNYPDIQFHLGQQPFASSEDDFNDFDSSNFYYSRKYMIEVDSVNADSSYFEASLIKEDI